MRPFRKGISTVPTVLVIIVIVQIYMLCVLHHLSPDFSSGTNEPSWLRGLNHSASVSQGLNNTENLNDSHEEKKDPSLSTDEKGQQVNDSYEEKIAKLQSELRALRDQPQNTANITSHHRPKAYDRSSMTFGHATLPPGEEDLFLYPIPEDVEPEHLHRYRSNGIYWRDMDDPLFRNYHQQLIEMRLRQGQGSTLPVVVENHLADVALKLYEANLVDLAVLWVKAYPYTLEQTTFPLFDGTTYIITGDIELMWQRDSCAQVNHYLPLLATEPSPNPLEALIEGLIRRQSLFILVDPYATSFRLFLDFDFKGKTRLSEWDYKSGRTIHVAMHNFELDNLAYHLKLSARFHQFSNSTRPFDKTWLKGFDKIMDTLETEQNHSTSSYTYPELKNKGKGTPVCNGNGLVWTSHRPSDDPTKMGYLIPANMMMVVSLRDAAKIVRDVNGGEDRALRAEALADAIDAGIQMHGVTTQAGYDKVYAYEVDACGNTLMMDDANIPSLLSIPYLEYNSPRDAENKIRDSTRRFVLSTSNPYFYDGGNGNKGIGSPHTKRQYVWHLAIIMQALTCTDDRELKSMMEMLTRTATNDLMHESFQAKDPTKFSRQSFAWANSLFAELISTRLDDIIRVMKSEPFVPQKHRGDEFDRLNSLVQKSEEAAAEILLTRSQEGNKKAAGRAMGAAPGAGSINCADYNEYKFPSHGCIVNAGSYRPHCQFDHILVDSSKIHSTAKAGARLEDVMGQPEEHEYVTSSKGAFVVETHPNLAGIPMTMFHNFSQVVSSMQVYDGQGRDTLAAHCEEWWNGTTLVVARYEYVNLYHTMTDWWNAFFSLPDANSTGGKLPVNILFLDAHPEGMLDSTWKGLFQGNVMRIQHLKQRTCFEHLRLSPIGYSCPLFPRDKGPSRLKVRGPECPEPALMAQFVDFVLERYNLTDIKRIPGRVVVIDRAPYVSHPRASVKETARTIMNIADVAHQLPGLVNNISLLDVHVHKLIDQTMQEQIRTIREASIVIGNHGAGMTHLVWLDDGAHVIEMSCSRSKTLNFFPLLTHWKPTISHHCLPLVEGNISDTFWKENVVSLVEEAMKQDNVIRSS